jgi:putative ABC transport system ATP-binding protein
MPAEPVAESIGGSPPAPALLHVQNLTREVAGRRLVDHISLEILRRDVLAIVGPSGSGKSSFLRLLNRLDEPTGGTVLVAGIDYRGLPPRDLRRRIGLVSQAPSLFPGSVIDNLRFGPARHAMIADNRSMARLLEQVGLAGYETRDVSTLSGGEAQRVALARTLANDPEVVLLDEPTSALDDVAKRQVEAVIAGLVQERSLTSVIVTHDAAQAARLGRRVMVMEKGRLVRIGTVKEVFNA